MEKVELTEDQVKVLKCLLALGGRMVDHVDLEKATGKKNIDKNKTRRVMARMVEDGYATWMKEDVDRPRSNDLFTLTPKGRAAAKK